MSAESPSAMAVRIAGAMNASLRDWCRSPEGENATDSPETLDAAIAGYKAGYLAALDAMR